MKILIKTLFLIQLIFITSVFAEEHKTNSRPKIGLVLAGGGALGFAHVGVIKVLEEQQVPVDYVAGTSMGAIIGAAYAIGVSTEEMTKVLTTANWDKLFDDNPPRKELPYRLKPGRERELFGDAKLGFKDGKAVTPAGLVYGQNILPLLQRLYSNAALATSNFDDFPIPYRAITADIETGKAVVIKAGDLATTVRASMSVPGFFAPVVINDQVLVDGGIANNLPIDVTLAMGADILIVVELNAELKKKAELDSPFSISGQIISLLLAQNSSEQKKLLRPKDILIEPDLTGYSSTDFKEGKDLITRGEEMARKFIPQLKKLSLSSSSYQAYKVEHSAKPMDLPIIEFIKINNKSKRSDKVISKTFGIKVGRAFDQKKIEQGLRRINRLGEFSEVRYSLVEEDGKKGLIVTATEKEWYNQYLRFGVALDDDFDGNSSYSLAIAYRANNLNSYGAWSQLEGQIGKSPRFFAELYQPLAAASPYFFAPEFEIGRQTLYVRDDSDIVADYHRSRLAGALKLGREIGHSGEFNVGYRRGIGKVERYIGDTTFPNFDYEIGEVFTKIAIDTLDKADFPTNGFGSILTFTQSVENLGGDDEFNIISGGLQKPISWDKNTLLFRGSFGVSPDGLPVERSFALGGFGNIFGFVQNSLTASDYGTGSVNYFYRIAQGGSFLAGYGFFVGGAIEASTLRSDIQNIPDNTSLISGALFLGMDTPLLPLYFGFGLAEGGNKSLYLNIGRIAAGR